MGEPLKSRRSNDQDPEKIKVILITSNASSLKLIEALLQDDRKSRFEILKSDLRSVLKDSFLERDILLVELEEPNPDSLHVISDLHEKFPNRSIVAFGEFDADELAFQIVQAGAGDYLVKKYLTSLMLKRVIRYSIERKKVEASFHESEKRYAELIETAPDPIVILNSNGIVEGANLAVEEVTGYPRSEFIGRPFWQMKFLDKKDIPRLLRIFLTFISGKPIKNVEYTVKHKDGRRLYFEANPKLLRRDGKITGIQVVSRDITERSQRESQLRKLNQAVEQSSSLVIITDKRGNIEYVNSKFTEVTGYSPEEVLGKNPRILKSGQTPQENYSRLWTAITSGQTWRSTLCNKRKNGEFYFASVVISPLRNEKGEITHYIGVQEDITELRRKESELEQTQKEFFQAQKMEAVAKLAGGVAHDFNNLLTVIRGYSDFLLDSQSLDPKARKYIEEISKASQRAGFMTKQLLAFSRKQTIALQVMCLDTVVSDMYHMLRRLMGENIEISMALKSGEACITADPGQIQQILMNLVVNARDAMPKGGSITIETSEQDFQTIEGTKPAGSAGDIYVMMAVTDTGTGMDEKIMARIFEPFFTTKEAGKGTGLGLSMVSDITKHLGGFIQISSRLGEGTTFRIYLPKAKSPAALPQGKTEPKAEKAKGGETILIVEDELMVRRFAAEVIKNRGYLVLQAGNGEEALSLVEKAAQKIDLVLTDIVMPIMGGVELAKALKARNKDFKMLFMSGYVDNPDTSELFEGEKYFLQKPFTSDSLLAKIREILDEGALS